MDYRTRHPDPHIWTSLTLAGTRPPAHYGQFGAIAISEVNAADGTEFLTLAGGLSTDEQIGTMYLIEADKTCPMRILLEAGQLSWIDFWNHRGWLLVIKFEMWTDADALATYVPSTAIRSDQFERLTKLGTISPYELKLRALENLLEMSIRWTEYGDPSGEVEEAERNYREFVAKYRHRIPSLNAAA